MKNDHSRPKHNARLLLAGVLIAWIMLVQTQAYAGPLTWQRHAVQLPDSIWSVETIDVTNNGRLEVIALGQTQVFALAAPDWKSSVLVDVREVKMIYCVALDADGDGDQDIALGRVQVPWIKYRQALAEGKNAQKPQGPDFSVGWIENPGRIDVRWPLHIVDRELNGVHGLCAGDVNGDGLEDLVADSIDGPLFPESVAWFQAPLSKSEEALPRRRFVSQKGAGGRPHYLDFTDLDGDGRGEVLLGDSEGNAFTSWEQGRDSNREWTKHLIAEEEGATNIEAARIDGNDSMDVVAGCGHGRGVFWYEGANWKKHVIDPDLGSPHALACGDFDGDGDTDVAAASYTEFIVRWYENDGNGSFTRHDIDTGNEQQAYDMKAVDLDSDGHLDILLAGRESRNVVWYKNRE